MEIKAKLQKPYTANERIDFIVQYNHGMGYTIKETELELQALSYTEDELAEIEKKFIATLKLTKREVFLALYKARGILPDDIKKNISDKKDLIEFEYANEYYRGNPLIDAIGSNLGFTSEDLDYLFKHKELPEKEVV